MKISLTLIAGSLILAIFMTFLVESRMSQLLSERLEKAFCWIIMLCVYLVCVGVAALVIGYFFHTRELVALAIGVPLGIPVLIAATKMA